MTAPELPGSKSFSRLQELVVESSYLLHFSLRSFKFQITKSLCAFFTFTKHIFDEILEYNFGIMKDAYDVCCVCGRGGERGWGISCDRDQKYLCTFAILQSRPQRSFFFNFHILPRSCGQLRKTHTRVYQTSGHGCRQGMYVALCCSPNKVHKLGC